jgi:hypothetical protein
MISTKKEDELSILRIDDYINFLKNAKDKNFTFFRVKDSKYITSSHHNIILRHDIDLSLKEAFRMAEIEAKESIYATYYVMVDGQYYNILEPENIDYLKKIKSMGHEIGLHFDISNYEDIQHQIKILEAVIEGKIFSMAQHTPVNIGFYKKDIANIIDAYTLTKYIPNLEYISDSGMMWRDYTFEEGLTLGKNLYLLAHPISWLNSKNSLISIIKEIKNMAIENRKNSFDEFIYGQIEYYKIRKRASDK